MDQMQEILEAENIAKRNSDLKPMRCRYCMKAWIKNGMNPNERPKVIYSTGPDNICPVCGEKFRCFFVF